jgi:hypothetical protein
MDAAGGVLDHQGRVGPLQSQGVEMKQVVGHDRVGLRAEELGPGGSGTAGCWVDPLVEGPLLVSAWIRAPVVRLDGIERGVMVAGGVRGSPGAGDRV